MTPVASKTLAPVLASGDDGDPHLREGSNSNAAVTIRFRPTMTERLAILGGAELELRAEPGGFALAVVSLGKG